MKYSCGLVFAILLLSAGNVVAGPTDLFDPISPRAGFLHGTQHLYPVQLRQGARQALSTVGGIWLTAPDGERSFARTVRIDDQRDGNRTWFGKVSTPHGERSVLITFGKEAVFGSLTTAAGKPMRLVTRQGKTYLVQQDEQAAGQALKLLQPRTDDYRLPPQVFVSAHALAKTRSALAAAATGATSPVIDVLLGFTPGMVTKQGSVSAVVTRLNYLISVTNQAYADSQVNGRVRLVGTMEVNYPDNSDDNTVLDDLTNASSSAPLASLRKRREIVGADLVSLVRVFSHTGQGGYCGLGFINGANITPFTTASAAYGYSTIGDGSDGGYYCLDTTLAHEMGHNMGLAHDQADATGPGVFSYAYGWRQTLSSGSFATIMAYPTGSQSPLAYFADPNITSCNGNRCGDAIQANQTSALNQTMPVVAAFNASSKPLLDINGDGEADVILQNPAGGQFTAMAEGANFYPASNRTFSVASAYHIAAVADLNGDHASDLIWTSAANDLYFWVNNGSGAYTSFKGQGYSSGWKLVGAGDLNGDGNDDLLWMNSQTHQFSYWLMNGTTVLSTRTMPVAAGYAIAAIGDLTGSGHVDLVWTSAARDLYFWINNGSGSFTSIRGLDYPAGWQLIGSGDVNGDQRADLIWTNAAANQFAYWLMNGATRVGYRISAAMPGYRIVGIDRYSGGTASMLWTSAANDLYLWQNDGAGNFSSSQVAGYPSGSNSYYYNYPSGWSVLSTLPSKP